jgi:hypothetical protein
MNRGLRRSGLKVRYYRFLEKDVAHVQRIETMIPRAVSSKSKGVFHHGKGKTGPTGNKRNGFGGRNLSRDQDSDLCGFDHVE